jgi:hypothetical protein
VDVAKEKHRRFLRVGFAPSNSAVDTVPITFDPSAPLGSRNDAPRGACGVVTHVIVVDETNRACKTCVVPVVSS